MSKPQVPSDPAERRDWIVAALRRNGRSMRQVAISLGVCAQAVQQALFLPSARIEEALAAELDVPVHVLFRERYRADGTRLCRTRPLTAEREAA